MDFDKKEMDLVSVAPEKLLNLSEIEWLDGLKLYEQ